MDLSLDRISMLLAALPHYTRPTIHIAGTNGKGSVTAILDSILRAAGLTTGRFNSPHFLFVRDSIRINGQVISQNTYQQSRDQVVRVDMSIRSRASSFEILTATALSAFEEAQVDVVILEVGLGGRLDATNAVPSEAVIACGITSIDLDHQAILGNTIEAIAREKAGILKHGVPCIVGRQGHPEVLRVMQEVADERKAEVVLVKDSCVTTGDAPILSGGTHISSTAPSESILVTTQDGRVIRTQLALLGAHQLDNVALAITILDKFRSSGSLLSCVTSQDIAQGIRNTRWPGRLHWTAYRPTSSDGSQRREMRVLVDGAHNTASSRALAAYLESGVQSSPRYFILSVSDAPPPKTPLSTLAPLLKKGDFVALVPFSPVDGMPWVKPVATELLSYTVRQLVGGDGNEVRAFPGLEDAFRWFDAMIGGQENVTHPLFVTVTGSLYLVADLFRLINGDSWAE
ncbi:folylpolyglutamate synthase [Tulasnella sp. 332]|nr:folylpolyglutamate synthase [Tulasnella sp. 332]